MKKSIVLILSIICLNLPSFAANKKMIPATGVENPLPNIFIYSLPDDDENTEEVQLEEDTQPLQSTILKGYAEFVEDSEAIHLKDYNDEFVLNIKVPQKISATKGLNLSKKTEEKPIQQYINSEYAIAPTSVKASAKAGDMTFGALYGNEIDNIAMLEKETGLFTKYEKERFALSTTYKKNLNTTYGLFYDTVSVAPELKLNNYMSVKNEYKADITRNRRSGAVIFSLNPFGKKDIDRMRLEVGAKQTVYMDTDFTKTEFSFSTQFKL